MHGHIADRQKRDVLNRIVALLFALGVIAERAGAMPAPQEMQRAELVAHSYVRWATRDCGAPLQWALPDAARNGSDREATLALAWWFRILAVALRDLPRRAFASRKARLWWRIELVRAACPVGLPMDRPIALDTS